MFARVLLPLGLLFCGVRTESSFECNILGTEVTSPDGVLESPPVSASNQNCIWLLEVPDKKFLKLNFTQFELRRQQLCVNSFVEFTSTEYNELRYCADQRPPVLTFAGPQEVMFYTRLGRTGQLTVPGFRAQFWTEDKYEPCSPEEQLCGNHKCYGKDRKCDGVDDCGDGTDEEGCGHRHLSPIICGKPVYDPLVGNEYIAGGRDALPGSWPWQVSLQMKNIFPSGHFCGATLIDNYWVLTAAHCFETRNASQVRARFGSFQTFSHGEGELLRNVEKVIPHPKYDPESIDNDIALLKMAAPVAYTDIISPVCLPSEKEALPDGSMVYTTGWGDGKYMEKNELLRQAMIPLISFDKCNEYYFGVVNKNTLCTHYETGGHSVCTGDSGGPLVYKSGNAWKQYGVVSWGHEDCGHRYWPSVYTEVSAFLPWIRSTIESQ